MVELPIRSFARMLRHVQKAQYLRVRHLGVQDTKKLSKLCRKSMSIHVTYSKKTGLGWPVCDHAPRSIMSLGDIRLFGGIMMLNPMMKSNLLIGCG